VGNATPAAYSCNNSHYMEIYSTLCHKILIGIEGDPNAGTGRGVSLDIPDYEPNVIGQHVNYLVESGMLSGIDVTNMQSPHREHIITDITPKGRAYLAEAAKNESLLRDALLLEDRNWRTWVESAEKSRENQLASVAAKAARDGAYQSGGRLKEDTRIVFVGIDEVVTKAVDLRRQLARKNPRLAEADAIGPLIKKVADFIDNGVSFMETHLARTFRAAEEGTHRALVRLAQDEAGPIRDRVKRQLESISLELRLMPESLDRPPITVHISGDGNNLNFGSVVGDLNASVQKLTQQGDAKEIAIAIERLSDAIQQSVELNNANKRDYLDHLTTIAEQVAKPPDNRRIATFKKAIEGVSTVATTVTKLIPLYDQLMKLLADHKIIDKLTS
jgi:hypothetical protein